MSSKQGGYARLHGHRSCELQCQLDLRPTDSPSRQRRRSGFSSKPDGYARLYGLRSCQRSGASSKQEGYARLHGLRFCELQDQLDLHLTGSPYEHRQVRQT